MLIQISYSIVFIKDNKYYEVERYMDFKAILYSKNDNLWFVYCLLFLKYQEINDLSRVPIWDGSD